MPIVAENRAARGDGSAARRRFAAFVGAEPSSMWLFPPGGVRVVSRDLRRSSEELRSSIATQRRDRLTGWNWCVSAFVLVAMVTTTTLRTGDFEVPSPALATAVVLAWAPLLLRTRRPVAALVGTVLADVVILLFFTVPEAVVRATEGMGAYQPVPLATMVAVFSVAARTPRRVGWGAGVGAGALLSLVGFLAHGRVTSLTDLVVFYLVATAAYLGVVVANRREAEERRARATRETTQQAILDERLRIARELHDVLAHNLTLVNAQAGVAAYLLEIDPRAAAVALKDITGHTRRAIDELRTTIGLLRYGEDDARLPSEPVDGSMRPVPGLASSLDELLDGFRAAGARIDVTVTGTPGGLEQHSDLAAYRIVQEALTNAAKHAPDGRVSLGIAWHGSGVRIRVMNAVPAADGRLAPPGTGHGLIGMRERAVAAGGQWRAGRVADGRFEVVAMLPSGDPSARSGHDDLPDLAPVAGSSAPISDEGLLR